VVDSLQAGQAALSQSVAGFVKKAAGWVFHENVAGDPGPFLLPAMYDRGVTIELMAQLFDRPETRAPCRRARTRWRPRGSRSIAKQCTASLPFLGRHKRCESLADQFQEAVVAIEETNRFILLTTAATGPLHQTLHGPLRQALHGRLRRRIGKHEKLRHLRLAIGLQDFFDFLCWPAWRRRRLGFFKFQLFKASSRIMSRESAKYTNWRTTIDSTYTVSAARALLCAFEMKNKAIFRPSFKSRIASRRMPQDARIIPVQKLQTGI
jgi:hypothetical protein